MTITKFRETDFSAAGRRWWLLAAAFALTPATLPGASWAQVKNPDTYTVVLFSDQDSLDPAYAYDTASHLIILNVYEPLLAYDGPSTEDLAPLIAEKVPNVENGLISREGRTYTFPIRKGVLFHDGTKLTPEDVKYSLMRFMLQDRSAGPASLLMEPILGYPNTRDEKGEVNAQAFKDADKAIEVKGSDVVINMPKANASLLTILASWGAVVSKKWAVAHGEWDGTESAWIKFNNPTKESSFLFRNANGTGPFALERWDHAGKTVILKRNDAYWRDPARLKRVVIRSVDEFATRKLMLQAGDADAILADRTNFSQLQNIPGVQIIDDLPTVEMSPVVYFTYKINPAANVNIGSGRLDGDGIPPDFFSDKDVRKAFAYAFDYQAFIKDVNRGKGTQATGAIPKSLPGHNPGQKTYKYDPGMAAEHIKKAWKGQAWEKGFKFTLTFNSGNVPRQTLAQIIKRNVEALNPKFHIDVRPVMWSTFLDQQRAHKLPLFTLGWAADYPDPHNFAFPFYHSLGNYPQVQGFKNEEMDELVDKGLAETNLKKRKKIYAKLQALAYEEVPSLIIIDSVRFRTQRDWVKGWYHNPIFPDSPYGSYFYTIYKE